MGGDGWFEYKTKNKNIVCCIEKDKCKIYTYHDASNSGVTSMCGTTHNATFDNWSFICVVTASNVSYIQISYNIFKAKIGAFLRQINGIFKMLCIYATYPPPV